MSDDALYERIAAELNAHGITWNMKGRGSVQPTADDVMLTLNTAAVVLRDENPQENPQIEVGGLVIQKTTRTHKVYVYVGDFD